MLKKVVASALAACLAWSGFLTTGALWAAEGTKAETKAEAREKEPQIMRTIVGRGDDGWAVVDIWTVRGRVVVVSPKVGREIDLAESNRYALFQGRDAFNEKVHMRIFDLAIPGLQSAMFLKRDDGRFAVRVRFRSGPRILDRVFPLRNEDELRRLREYIEHFSEIQTGKYQIGDKSKLGKDAAFPKVTDEEVSFQEEMPRFRLMTRVPAEVVLKSGESVKGELVPAFEDGQIMVQSGLNTRRIRVADIDRLRFHGDRGSNALGMALQFGIGSAATGALMGALAAWQADASAKKTAIFAAAVFGAAGFISGLLRGARSGRGNREFVLGPVSKENWKKEKKDRSRWGEGADMEPGEGGR